MNLYNLPSSCPTASSILPNDPQTFELLRCTLPWHLHPAWPCRFASTAPKVLNSISTTPDASLSHGPHDPHTGWCPRVQRAIARDFALTMSPSTSPEPGPDGKLSKVQTQRARWATRKMTVKSSSTKRLSLLNRMQQHKRTQSEKSATGGDGNGAPFEDRDPHHNDDENDNQDAGTDEESSDDDEDSSRMLYFNIPLPDDMLEDGSPIHTFPRNKIRTAKYTPLSFIPKNLWFQFHNVANIFFLFLVILVVCSQMPTLVPLSLRRRLLELIGANYCIT